MWQHVEQNWGAVMDFAATLEARIEPTSRVLQKLQAAGEAKDQYRALAQIGRIEKTIVELSYAGFEELRRETLVMHNKQEHHNGLKSELFWGNKGEIRLAAEQDIQNRHACLKILSSLIMLYNAAHLQAAWRALKGMGHPIDAEHVNFVGDVIFANSRKLQIPIDKVVSIAVAGRVGLFRECRACLIFSCSLVPSATPGSWVCTSVIA